jgi:hypothetical protein
LLKIVKNKKNMTFIVSEKQYIRIIATINSFRSTLASCEVVNGAGTLGGHDVPHRLGLAQGC